MGQQPSVATMKELLLEWQTGHQHDIAKREEYLRRVLLLSGRSSSLPRHVMYLLLVLEYLYISDLYCNNRSSGGVPREQTRQAVPSLPEAQAS